MPSVKDIAMAVEAIAPLSLAEEWDNVGALVDCGGEVNRVMVALDITDDVVNEAEAKGCQLILAHHPVIFGPLRRVGHKDVVYRLIKKGISAVCAHTNLDAAAGGVNDILSALLGLADTQVFAGIGRVGNLASPVSAQRLAAVCAARLNTQVRLCDAGRNVSRLAVLGGSGGGLLAEALTAGADALLTGEADHHDAIDARHAGVSVIAAGHFASEYPVVPVLANWLAKRFSDIDVQTAKRGKDPFVWVCAKPVRGKSDGA